MADATMESEAADLLNALERLGLTGQRLAVSQGTEEGLTKQLVEYISVSPKEWHLGFIKAQVRAAVQIADLDRRVRGEAASSSVQMISEAGMAPKARADLAKDENMGAGMVHVPRRGGLGKSVRLRSGRLVMETEVEAKVRRALLDELGRIKAPILQEIEQAMNPTRAAQAVMSKYRASTVRRYLASWQQFRKWFEMTAGEGAEPSGIHLVDYLYVREEEGMGASIPMAVVQAVGWFENLADIPAEHRMLSHPMVDMVVKELTKKLQERADPVKRAPRLLACFFEAMEEVVVGRIQPKGRRICAWVKLVKAWGALRFSDISNVKGNHFKLVDGNLVGLLFKTKTTGAGKRIRELPIYISSGAYVREERWLSVGFELVKRASTEEGPFVFSEGIFTETATGQTPMKYHEASAASADLFESLLDERGRKLIPTGWERFWTEHSERATLSSGLAAVGVGKLERDMLGRWCPEGSDQYVRTYNAAVGRLQKKFSRYASTKNAYKRLDEGSTLEDLKRWLHGHWGANEQEADRAVESWKKGLGVIPSDGQDDGSDTDIASSHGVEEVAEEVENPKGAVSATIRSRKANLDQEREGGFVVVYRRAGKGTLHRLGEGSCWMARKRSFVKSETYEQIPEVEFYSVRCKLCWPPTEEDPEGSTSDSCDEVELSDDSEMEM